MTNLENLYLGTIAPITVHFLLQSVPHMIKPIRANQAECVREAMLEIKPVLFSEQQTLLDFSWT
jgi:hypothetical protein